MKTTPAQPSDKSAAKPAATAASPDGSPSDSRMALLPALAAVVLFIVTLVIMVRGGVSADLSGVDPASFNTAHQIIFARYVGILSIVLSSLASLAAMAAGTLGLGLVLRKLLPSSRIDLLTHFTVGLGLLWLFFEALALMGFANAVVAWGVCLAALLAGVSCHAKQLQQQLKQSQSFLLAPYFHWHGSSVLVASPLAVLLVAACCPPGTLWSVEAYGYDVLSYHLQIPREWLTAGQAAGLQHNVYSYLPSLVEVAFLQLGAMRSSVYQATYTCQLLNVGLCILAAAHLARLVRTLTPGPYASACSWFTAAIFLATPWVLVTGSMAYDEAAVLAFGAAALSLSLSQFAAGQTADKTADKTTVTTAEKTAGSDSADHRWQIALLVGVLAGLATQAKLTSGFMIALPVGLIWLLQMLPDKSQAADTSNWRAHTKPIALLVFAGVLILLPYFARNAAWAGGNPVFPFAAHTLGQGHWNDELVTRWNQGHQVDESISQRMTALGQQWLFNTGYGSIGGRARSVDPSKPEARNVAYFPKQWGVPTLLLAALAGWLVLLFQSTHRRLAIALGVMLLVQILAWLFLTHLQSRFMIFSLLPVCIAAGAGLACASHRWLISIHVAVHGVCVILVATLVLVSAGLLRQQVIGQLPLWQVIDTLPLREEALDRSFDRAIVGDHPINKLPATSRTLLIADNSRLFYIHRQFVYHSAFDQSTLGDLIRQHPGDPMAVTQSLKAAGITHVWLHGPELNRLMGSYGFDKDVNPVTLQTLINTGWRPVAYRGRQQAMQASQPLVAQVELYELP